jgi:hypothetical protein
MAGSHRPLRFRTMIMFGSLEFMFLGIEYDMVLLPPAPPEDRGSRHRPSRRRRQRWSSHNRAPWDTLCVEDAAGHDDDIESLSRDLASINISLGVPAPTFLAPPAPTGGGVTAPPQHRARGFSSTCPPTHGPGGARCSLERHGRRQGRTVHVQPDPLPTTF